MRKQSLTLLTFLLIFCVKGLVGDDAVIDTDQLPDISVMPTLSNGHIGFVINGDAILLNGLYNGERGESHRARIPSNLNFRKSVACDAGNCNYQLNMRQGFYQETRTSGTNYRLIEQIFAHRYFNRAIVKRLRLERLEGVGGFFVNFEATPSDPSVDLTQVAVEVQTTIAGRQVTIMCYVTNVVEDAFYQKTPSTVCVGYTALPTSLSIAAGENSAELFLITAVARTEAEVRKELNDAIMNENTLFESHTRVWEEHWRRMEIAVEGNSKLNTIVHASIFYLISNLPSESSNQPNDPFYGLSPSGIGKGGVLYAEYQGHSFWDTEMWMHPPVLLLNPKWSEDLLGYRFNVRKAAEDNARNTGYKGYRFPWESGFTGREVTPDCCPEVVEYQHHIISDIAFAFRSHFAATHDTQWLENVGCDVAYNTAKFWESRVRYNQTTKMFDIRNVMGPDEDHHDIDNNGYTNVNAAINLLFGEYAGCACRQKLGISDADYEEFAKIARSLVLLYDEERDFHPQYEGYEDGTMIKQADTVLLGFPLQMPMDAETKRNNLLIYDKVTRENGPAMTWAMHTVGFLDLHDEAEATKVFERSFELYTREPFRVWSEVIPGTPGAGNFITGAGGFLQSVINGYAGVRLHFDSMKITNFYVPSGATSLTFNGINYLKNRFSLKISGDQATLTFQEIDADKKIKATLKPTGEVFEIIIVGRVITFSRDQELTIEAVEDPVRNCEIRETVIGQEAVQPEPVVEETEWVLGANKLPDPSEVPTLSNGHLGFVVNGDAILINGLYNGERGQSHRARIPNYATLATSATCVLNSCEYRLNMRQGFFETKISYGRRYRLTQQTYAHRYYNRAIVNRFVLERLEGTEEYAVVMMTNPGDEPGVDLTQVGDTKSDRVAQRDITVRCYETNIVEDAFYQPSKSRVCVAHTNIPMELRIPAAVRSVEYLHITAVGRTEAEVRKEIQDIFTREVNHDAIFKRHTDIWEKHWDEFGISVRGNMKTNQIVHASIFYLISNLPSESSNQPNDPFYGLSPSGIGKGGVLYAEYQGHSFWDTEMWMHPPVLLLNPKWSEDLLTYRFNVRKAAEDNARNTGYKGYRFPWESGFTGREVTPDCCPQVVEFQHHVIADIAFAFRAHLAATHDLDWFESVGCDIAFNTAKFWESRVKFDEDAELYNISGVMGPDEDAWDVDNNVYTNVNAAINLYFGDFATCACKDRLKPTENESETFAKIARSLKLLYDEEGDFHPQFEGFNDSITIKQADVVLLGYPLQLPMKSSTKRNNLLKYDKVTRLTGPAMTWAMHTIGFLDLFDQAEAAKVFERSYSLYSREPFKVWSENIPGTPGAGNFITGAGGFLQSILNGYGGVRLHFDRLSITNFYVPPQSSQLEFNGITYLGNQFSLTIYGNQAEVVFKKIDSNHPLKVNIGNVEYSPTVGVMLKFSRDQEMVMRASQKTFGTCEMKETVLGQKAGGVALKMSLMLMFVVTFVRKVFL